MDITEAIKKRKSVRGFKPDSVPRETLRELMNLALRSPSWANIQPWEFAIATGKKLDEIKQSYAMKVDEDPRTDFPFPRLFPEPYASRRPSARTAPAANRDDKDRRREMRLQGSRMHGAPCMIYICTDRAFYVQQDNNFNVYPIFDCGLIAENIMLIAVNYGLSTVPMASSVWYPNVLKKVLEIPDSKLIVFGIAIGYPDENHPTYKSSTPREPLDSVVKWYGF